MLTDLEQQTLDLFNNNTLGWNGHYNTNGSDWYNCTGCYTRHKVMGFADAHAHITEYRHVSDCALKALYDGLIAKSDRSLD